eukprot:363272-Chlamydomonas_euryale.AAC.4
MLRSPRRTRFRMLSTRDTSASGARPLPLPPPLPLPHAPPGSCCCRRSLPSCAACSWRLRSAARACATVAAASNAWMP